jgi:hypothetical protein
VGPERTFPTELKMHKHIPHTQLSVSRRTYITLVVLYLGLLNAARVLAQTDSQPPPFGGPWDSRVKLDTVSKIKKHIPNVQLLKGSVQ